MKKYWILILLILLALPTTSLNAQTPDSSDPVQTARTIQQELFNAQAALLRDDTTGAVAAAQTAADRYTREFAESAPDSQLETAFADALTAAETGNARQLAAARGHIWAGLLAHSTQMITTAIQDGDAATAARWLPLREFRTSTRFSRPGADATLAVQALAAGDISPEVTLERVTADLLDTYQAQFTAALNDADEAQANGFTIRQTEETALAAGYFAMLSASYEKQRGPDSLAEIQAALTALEAAADTNQYAAAREQVETLLAGFRAAPLSEAELARRAGQFSRFIALVAVEYARGVRHGIVTSDIEIQEALTFYDGAAAAFADLQPALAERDAANTARIAQLLSQVSTQIRAVAEPTALQTTTDEISRRFTEVIPAEWASNTDSDVDVILSVLDQMETAVQQGEYALAESSRLEAYALLELGMEQRLRGFAPDLAVQIESLFWQGTSDQPGLATLLGTQAEVTAIKTNLTALRAAFADAQNLLNSAKAAPGAVVGNAAVIVFREGLEAVLILASLLASLRTLEERRYRRPLVMGAALAFVATAITWWFATNLLSLLLPLGERLEAVVSLIAIGVLLLITNWFFHKVYWTGWMANFHARKRRLVGGVAVITLSQTAGLVLLGFTSIYREGFETVLFLQSLVLEAGTSIVLQGVALGLFGTAIVGLITFALQVRLPYKKMLIVTGVMIGGVLLIMVGNTVHVMQSVGWLPITPINGVYFPFWLGQWFGLFATWQGVTLQAVAGGFVIGSYFLAEYQNKRQRQQRVRPGAQPVTEQL